MLKNIRYKRAILILAIIVSPFTIVFAQILDIESLDDAVVLVEMYDYKEDFIGHGSGFIIDVNGTVVTNYHVVKGVHSLKVILQDNYGQRTSYNVQTVVKGSEIKDLAILKIKNPYHRKFKYLKIANSLPKKGEECWAIGTPANPKYMNTVSTGLVSNLALSNNPKLIQTTAEISHGSSGGPLINKNGEVIGVTSSGDGTEDGARASINFAIWIGEITNLPTIGKERVIDPRSIPCELSFYTKNPFIGVVYLYVDGNYIGSFTKYLSSIPECRAEGTITRTLYSGEHSYYVYYPRTGQHSYGKINLTPGQCQIIHVAGQTSQRTVTRSTTSQIKVTDIKQSINYIFTEDDTRLFGWTFFTHISGSTPYSANHFDPGPILSFGIEKNIGNRLSLLVKFQDLAMYTSSGISQTLDGRDLSKNDEYSVKNDHMAFIADLKIFSDEIEDDKGSSNLWFGPSFGLVALKKEVIDPIGINTQYPKKIGVGFGLRLGFDKFISKRLVFTSDIVLMKFNKNVIDEALHWGTVIKPTAPSLNINLGLGLRFLKNKK
jgi:hypothetical protein